ncbi:MAG: SGNH/GDSL hydrolase family protein [Eubacteriales bacterium]|nr:SGNH/GDSL hydrolase family protein [Eubacteriales bacterium]
MRRIAAGIGTAVLVILLLACLQQLLKPKYTGSVLEGCFTEEYYREPYPHELLILGNCDSYENISPVTLWNEYGITSYIRGNSNQLIPQSYYLLKDALKDETPKAVLLNVQAMTVEGQTTEEYNRMVFDGMRWSGDKLAAIRATAMEDEHLLEYVFPLLRYHSRWQELSGDDLRYAFSEVPSRSFNGYYLRADVRPYTEFPAERRRPDYTFPEINTEYLDRIRELCEENGIRLILMKAPALYPEWPEPYEDQIASYAKAHGLTYYNTLALSDEIGLDMSEDTYDEGLHLNVYGAEKVARWLGAKLSEEIDFTDFHENAEINKWYTELTARYEAEKARQAEEFAQTGSVTLSLQKSTGL